MNNPGLPRIAAILSLALLVFATVLGVIASGDNVLAQDLSVARTIQDWQHDLGEELYRVGDTLGTTANAAVITVIVLLAAIIRKQLQLSLFLIFVLVLRLLGTLLKPIFDSPRPTSDLVQVLEAFDGSGYPSGHSMTAAMVAAMLILVAWRYSRQAWIRWAVSIAMFSVMVLVGWSRIWAGAHWPSDVLGGWSFGIALVLIAWIASNAVATRRMAAGYSTS